MKKLAAVFCVLCLALTQALAEPEFVGSQACAGCHVKAYSDWQGSQHQQAMQHASAQTVLGDFANARFIYNGVESVFFQKDGRFFVTTDGPSGTLETFAIAYTFGVDPLQQYLIELPDGRVQALSIAWDSRPKEQGGQRWMHLYPDEKVSHKDALHWSAPSQNWNYMCADCHSTHVQKGFDEKTKRFNTRFSEISVGCEACHGPASEHLKWAKGDSTLAHQGLALQLNDYQGATWRRELDALTATRSTPNTERQEQQVCAQCHSRRQQIQEGFAAGKNFFDHYRPALLTDDLYHLDGQQKEEVFISASFAQSKMHEKGVTCSNCHEPHTQQLRAQGNALCSQCHAPKAFDTPKHHFHPKGVECVSCHMPETTYMVIDARRDHQLSIPRPDLTKSLGVPNACQQCHADQTDDWAVAAIAKAHPKARERHFANIWAQATQVPDALNELAELINDPTLPEMIRASSSARLSPRTPKQWQAQAKALTDPSPLVREAAIEAFATLEPTARIEAIAPLLSAKERSVRTAAARVLVGLSMPKVHQEAFAKALGEYEAALALNADRADAQSAKASMLRKQGKLAQAITALEAAIGQDRFYAPAYAELADIYRTQYQEAKVKQVLEQGLLHNPQAPLLHYLQGLYWVRAKDLKQAQQALAQAHQWAPNDARFGLTLVLALKDTEPSKALSVCESLLSAHPTHQQLLWLGATLALPVDKHKAQGYLSRLKALNPAASEVQALEAALKQAP